MNVALKWAAIILAAHVLGSCCGSQEYTRVEGRIQVVPVPDTPIDGAAGWNDSTWFFSAPGESLQVRPVYVRDPRDSAEVARFKEYIGRYIPTVKIVGVVKHDSIMVAWDDTMQVVYPAPIIQTPFLSKLGLVFIGVVGLFGASLIAKGFGWSVFGLLTGK
jgi:hypothetical protein